jgi:hypothetical protein
MLVQFIMLQRKKGGVPDGQDTRKEEVELSEETPAERIDRISKANVAKRAAAAKVEREKTQRNTAAFQAHKKEVLAKGGRPVDALDSWQKKKMKKEILGKILRLENQLLKLSKIRM